MAPHSSTLAWKIPWTEEPGRLQSMGSLGVGHDWATSLSLFTFTHWEGNGNPLQCSCLENPRNRGAWWAAVYGVAQSQTWLKGLSRSHSSMRKILLYLLCRLENWEQSWVIAIQGFAINTWQNWNLHSGQMTPESDCLTSVVLCYLPSWCLCFIYQTFLKEINPEYSLEGLMPKLKL